MRSLHWATPWFMASRSMLNFAHGDIIMVGGFTVFTIVTTMGGSPVVGILASVVVCTVLGVTIERVAYRPLRDASPLAVLITAIGVSYLLQNVALLIFGSNARQFTSVITVPALKLAGGKLSISGVTIVTILSLYRDYGCPDDIYQQDENGAGDAGGF